MSQKKHGKQPYEPTNDELSGSPRAFEYELQMFRWCVQMLELSKNLCTVLVNDYLRDSVIEAALLHARDLLDFFTGDQPMKGDLNEDSIRAGHFLRESCDNRDGRWEMLDLPRTKSRKSDINKSLSHLTFARVQGHHNWDDLPKIKDEIEVIYSTFLRRLPEGNRGKWPAPATR